MFEKDYFMRMIQEFARVIARILGLKENGDYHEALKVIDHTYLELLKLDPAEFHRLNKPQWEGLLTTKSVQEREMIAELLQIEGEILLEMKKPADVCNKFSKALEILREVAESEKSYSLDRMNKIARLEEWLAGMNNTE